MPTRTYLDVLPLLGAFGVVLFRGREQLLGANPGTHWSLIGIALFLFGYCPMTSLEERELLDRFGDAYREYQRDVPRLIPRLRRGA
jgi:protein-S-isoprenylcysteine O-methyltransferase Ste14